MLTGKALYVFGELLERLTPFPDQHFEQRSRGSRHLRGPHDIARPFRTLTHVLLMPPLCRALVISVNSHL